MGVTLPWCPLQVEVGERKDRVTDALNATKAAVDEGIVAGGGAALLHASRTLDKVRESMMTLDERVGVEIIMRAVQMPAKTICKNAGHEGAVIVGKLLESDDPNFGYDAAKGVFCNMVEAGAMLQHWFPPWRVLLDLCCTAGLCCTVHQCSAGLVLPWLRCHIASWAGMRPSL
jgi:hypothetical protein